MQHSPQDGLSHFAILVSVLLAVMIVVALYLAQPTGNQDSINNVAGKLNSAGRLNYYARSVNTDSGVPIHNCQDITATLNEPLSSDYEIISQPIARDAIVKCTLNGPGGLQTYFYVRGIR